MTGFSSDLCERCTVKAAQFQGRYVEYACSIRHRMCEAVIRGTEIPRHFTPYGSAYRPIRPESDLRVGRERILSASPDASFMNMLCRTLHNRFRHRVRRR